MIGITLTMMAELRPIRRLRRFGGDREKGRRGRWRLLARTGVLGCMASSWRCRLRVCRLQTSHRSMNLSKLASDGLIDCRYMYIYCLMKEILIPEETGVEHRCADSMP